MAGLTDMEELIATVPEKDIASYLREAMVCYGAGAYRGCIVLTHISLFEGLRQKLLALAPVNAVARTVLAVIEPLAASQKVFELTMIQQMKGAGIITQLESDILEQLNRQRNKAAHPSGHFVTPEEARFVFSEAIQKFLSRPIRTTSVAVSGIIAKIAGPNFFPSVMMPDINAVTQQETQPLDPAGMPQLVAKLVEVLEGTDPVSMRNAGLFLLSLASRHDLDTRATIVKGFIDPKATNDVHAENIAMLIAVDPSLLVALSPATRMRVEGLLLKNANTVGTGVPFTELRNPAHVLASCVSVLGEAFMIANYKQFADWVISKVPYSPEFVRSLKTSPTLLKTLADQYFKRASHSQFDVSNPFAAALPAMDSALAEVLSDEDAFRMVAAVVMGAYWNGYGPMEIANGKFASMPAVKAKAAAFVTANPTAAQTAISSFGLPFTLPTFMANYF
ncbi:hypothetical protein [Bradyrhizobium ottawaense]|uniref:hypothetical protein n=1 Tax=Bradyrhizobium ottawaense TaxID=931866 RepID=UPI001BA9B5A2|nr:hypothetical protein [Bradyrhizobium ottawaense]MBR1366346.1 hypothetical protein [Bradyrhizobium ottawaense]